jgi:hypothetical protein
LPAPSRRPGAARPRGRLSCRQGSSASLRRVADVRQRPMRPAGVQVLDMTSGRATRRP